MPKITIKKVKSKNIVIKSRKQVSKTTIIMHRKYLNGYYYWINLDTQIIYDEEENDFSRIGCIAEDGEFIWD